MVAASVARPMMGMLLPAPRLPLQAKLEQRAPQTVSATVLMPKKYSNYTVSPAFHPVQIALRGSALPPKSPAFVARREDAACTAVWKSPPVAAMVLRARRGDHSEVAVQSHARVGDYVFGVL